MTDSVKSIHKILEAPAGNIEEMAEKLYELVIHLASIKKINAIKHTADNDRKIEKLTDQIVKTYKSTTNLLTSFTRLSFQGITLSTAFMDPNGANIKQFKVIGKVGSDASDTIKGIFENRLTAERTSLQSLMEQIKQHNMLLREDNKNLSHENDRAEKALETIHRGKEALTR